MKWLEDFQYYIGELKKVRPNLILCGDYNICHRPIDIHDPVRNATNSGFLPEKLGMDYHIHSADEFILVSEMEEAVLIYMEAIKNLLAI